jgi:hypothetical protein
LLVMMYSWEQQQRSECAAADDSMFMYSSAARVVWWRQQHHSLHAHRAGAGFHVVTAAELVHAVCACRLVFVTHASSICGSITWIDLCLFLAVVAAAAAARYVAEGGDWRKSYYMPTRADAAIMAMRKWMDKHAGGGIPWPEHLQVCS